MDKGTIVAICFVAAGILLMLWALWYDQSYKKKARDTQRTITDLDLLRLFEKQPGGLLSAELVAQKTELTKSEASARLYELTKGMLLTAGATPNGMKNFFELSAPLETVPDLQLSEEPFITIEDLQAIFLAYDYKVSPHDLMVATGLPWRMLSREMQYFRKQGIVEVTYINRPGDSAKQYILAEAYHHQSMDLEAAERERLNGEMRELLYNERFLV